MTERLTIETGAPCGLIAVELWDGAVNPRLAEALGALPPIGRSASLGDGWRAIRVEPAVWWLSGPRDGAPPVLDRLAATLGGSGAVVDLAGGFVPVRIAGEGWRELLTMGGVFDAEDPAFASDCTAGTILHHVAVRYDVVAADEVRAYVPPSYVDHLLHHWRAAAARM